MRVRGPLAWLVRWLAGSSDAESMLADLEDEADERAARDGIARARLWLAGEVVRSAPTLIARRLADRRDSRKGWDIVLSGLWLDLQHVLRRLRRSPGFAAFAVALLGIGVGATTSVFSLAYAIWLKPLPYQAPEDLIAIAASEARTGRRSGSSGAELADIRASLTSVAGVAGYHYAGIIARINGEPLRLAMYPTTVKTLHADPAVLGESIGGGEDRVTVIGVMPRGFRFPLILEADGWTPTLRLTGDRASRLTNLVARLKPGATLARTNAELLALSARLATTYPASNRDWVLDATPIDAASTPASRAALATLLTMVGLFLIIACANLASLFVARNLARRAELTLALAIGASPARIARTLLVESVIISTLGASLGVP